MCNAGINWVHPGLTVDGYERIFGTNHLGHALLIKLLLPNLLDTANEPGSDVRVISLSSSGHRQAPKEGIIFKDLKTTQSHVKFYMRYGQSKLANILYARSLARKYPTIKIVSVHPGVVDSNIHSNEVLRDSISWRIFWWNYTCVAKIQTLLTGSGWETPEVGAKTQLWAATGKKDEVVSGTYYAPVGVMGRDSKMSKDEKLMEELWEWTEAQLEKFCR